MIPFFLPGVQKPGYRADLYSALSTGLPAARYDCSELHSEILAALLVESPVEVGRSCLTCSRLFF